MAGTPASRTALITGASRGIGRALALGLAERGVALGLLARDAASLAEVVDECRDRGVEAVGVPADVTDRDAVPEAVEAVAGELDRIDLVVNNAGLLESVERPFGDTDVDETWRVIEVNVLGPMLVMHAALPVMLAGGGGRVVNISSGLAYKAMTEYTGYAVSKGALARFTTQLDAQYRDQGVFTFDVSPGNVRTDMSTSMPMQAGRTIWTPVEAVVELVAGIADGQLDQLSGRHFRAGADTVESLQARRDEIVSRNARVLDLVTFGPDDPIR